MSNLPPRLTALLRCPVTGSALLQQGDSLLSTGTGTEGQTYRYAIDEGIPVLLASAATAIPASGDPGGR